MKTAGSLLGLGALVLTALAGCDLPGKPKAGPEVPRPEEVLAFETLYAANCAGCHGANGQNGAATNLANPEYQALIDDASLREVIAKGMKGTLMPAFAQENGGMLTDAQIDALVQGIRASWRKPDAFGGENPPPYKATHAGDAAKGTGCLRDCMRAVSWGFGAATGEGGVDSGWIVSRADQRADVRTTVIAGRPDIGEPDWRGHIPGRAMTDDEITDVSAWLMSQKPVNPGQPYPAVSTAVQTPERSRHRRVKH